MPDGSYTKYQRSSAHDEKVGKTLNLFSQLVSFRSTFAGHWEEVANLVLPNQRNTFFYGNRNVAGEKKTSQQIDAQGALALTKFKAILNSLITPKAMQWHGLKNADPYVMKDRATRLWYEDTTRRLFSWRYRGSSGFVGQNMMNWESVGAFGTSCLFIDKFDGGPGMRYKNVQLGEYYPIENHQGIIDGCIRWFRMTAAQAYDMPGWREYLPESLTVAMEKETQKQFEFLHYVRRRGEDYDPDRFDVRGKRYESCYISIEGRCILGEEGGYRTFPFATARYEQVSGEVYGRSPAMAVLPALKTKNAQKTIFLKQGHRAADPVLLTADDGIVDFSLRPGALNKGGMNQDGRPLVGTLPTGDVQLTKEMMDVEAADIDDAFLVSLFKRLIDAPQMTATQVIELANEKGILLAPTAEAVASERLDAQVDRELDVLAAQRLIAPMPPRLLEARGSYEVVQTNPLAKAAKAQEAAGFMRTVETTKELVGITQDPALLDPFDFDVAIPAIAEIQSVPESWMASPEKIAQKRKARGQAQQQQAQIQAAPAKAAMMKAQAAMMKAGAGAPGEGI